MGKDIIKSQSKKMKVLCLDVEGGFGGSSRSLYFSLKHMDRQRVTPVVWCKKDGPIKRAYDEMGIECHVKTDMSIFHALPKLSRNLYFFTKGLIEFYSKNGFRKELLRTLEDDFDLVHFNHSSIFYLGSWLKKQTDIPFTLHIRTRLKKTIFAKIQYQSLQKSMNRIIYISENEQDNVREIAGFDAGTIIYNITEIPDHVEPQPQIPQDGRLKAFSISNFSPVKALERYVEAAEILKKRNKKNILFVLAGNMKLSGPMSDELVMIAKRGGDLSDFVKHKGLEEYFLFLGHVPNPECVVAGCDVLYRTSRGLDPWGRDVFEAMAQGRPVITTGKYDKFVKHGITGFLMDEYEPEKMVDSLLRVADDRDLLKELGENGIKVIRELNDGEKNSRELLKIWQQTAGI